MHILSGTAPPSYSPALDPVPSSDPAQITSSAVPPELPYKPALQLVPVQYSTPDACHSVNRYNILSISLVSLQLSLIQTITNVVVVQDQPKPTVYTVQTTDSKISFGDISLWVAVLLTICTLILGCWFASIFSLIALSLAAAVSV